MSRSPYEPIGLVKKPRTPSSPYEPIGLRKRKVFVRAPTAGSSPYDLSNRPCVVRAWK